jgi:DNA-binding transcriptional LysR family regulator
VAPTLAGFVEQNPGVIVSVHDGDASSVERLMHTLSADFGVTGYWKEHPDFVVEPLTVDRCCVICPPGHRFANRKSLSIKDLHGLPIVSLNRDAGTRRLIETQCAAHGVRLVVQFEVARVSTLVEMVSSGMCISVLTVLSTPHNAGNTLRIIPFREPELTYPINIIMRANKVLTPSAARFVEALRKRFSAQRQN